MAAAPPLSIRKKLCFTLVTLALLALLGEGLFRLLGPRFGVESKQLDLLRNFSEGRASRYDAHPYLIYTLRKDAEGVNSLGFRDAEWAREKEEGALRIACLGASTTYGFTAKGREQAYPGLLAQVLTKKLKRPVECLNFGVPSWTSAETMLNYFLNVKEFAPDVVLLHHAHNDVRPREKAGFRADYSHFRSVWKSQRDTGWVKWCTAHSDVYAWIRCRFLFNRMSVRRAAERDPDEVAPRDADPKTVMTPETLGPFRRNLRSIGDDVQAQGGSVVLMTMPHCAARGEGWAVKLYGMQQHNDAARSLAGERGYALIDMAAEWNEHAKRQGLFTDLVHLTRPGLLRKASYVADALIEQKVVVPAPQ